MALHQLITLRGQLNGEWKRLVIFFLFGLAEDDFFWSGTSFSGKDFFLKDRNVMT